MRVSVDRSVCQGHGVCVMLAPRVYTISDDDGLAYVTMENVPEGLRDEAVAGMNNCPERAISISD